MGFHSFRYSICDKVLNIWKLIVRKYQFRLPYFRPKFYSLSVRAERKLLEAWQRLTYAWKWCENRDFRTFFTLSTIVNKNYKTGECQGLKWRTKHGIKKTKRAKGRKEMHPARKETCKSANEKLNIFNLTDLRICVRRFKGHQNGVEIFPFFKFWHCILKFPNKQSPRYVACLVTQNVESNVNDMSNVIKLCKLYIASALLISQTLGFYINNALDFLPVEQRTKVS